METVLWSPSSVCADLSGDSSPGWSDPSQITLRMLLDPKMKILGLIVLDFFQAGSPPLVLTHVLKKYTHVFQFLDKEQEVGYSTRIVLIHGVR